MIYLLCSTLARASARASEATTPLSGERSDHSSEASTPLPGERSDHSREASTPWPAITGFLFACRRSRLHIAWIVVYTSAWRTSWRHFAEWSNDCFKSLSLSLGRHLVERNPGRDETMLSEQSTWSVGCSFGPMNDAVLLIVNTKQMHNVLRGLWYIFYR